MSRINYLFYACRLNSLLMFAFFFLFASTMSAQAPEGITYKGVAYHNGSLVAEQDVTLKCSIREASASGTVIYTESHNVMTNANGVYSVLIGSGDPVAFAAISWWPLQKFLQIELDPIGGTTFTQNTVTPMTSVPYALYSKTTLTAGGMPTFVDNITALRSVAGSIDGEVVGIKGYNVAGDGGGGFFKWHVETPYRPNGHYYLDNGGTLIKGANSTAGIWVRQYDGMLNVAYFGALGLPGSNYTSAIQNAINYSEMLARTGAPNANTVYFPNGTYAVTQLTMKMGVSIKGESMEKTRIVPYNNTAGYLIVTESGRVRFNMSDIYLRGTSVHFTGNSFKGAINFTAVYKDDPPGDSNFDWGDYGSIEYTSLRNIKISNFQGHGILMEGGTRDDYDTPVQLNIFENVKITKGSLQSTSNALRMISQNGQNTFINCQFEGGIGTACSSGDLVYLKGEFPQSNSNVLAVAVLTFQNCAFQNADQAIRMNYVESVTVDNCFFSRLGEAISMGSSPKPCLSVNILNNRFSNAAGYGGLTGSSGFVKQNNFCIRSEGSAYTASGNYIVAGSLCSTCGFSYTHPTNLSNVTSANTFYQNGNYGSVGVTKSLYQSGDVLKADYHRVFYLDGNTFSSINSSISVGDTITIIASGGMVFSKSGNIRFPGLTPTIALNEGEVAVFRKTDEGNLVIYQLVSIVKSNP